MKERKKFESKTKKEFPDLIDLMLRNKKAIAYQKKKDYFRKKNKLINDKNDLF